MSTSARTPEWTCWLYPSGMVSPSSHAGETLPSVLAALCTCNGFLTQQYEHTVRPLAHAVIVKLLHSTRAHTWLCWAHYLSPRACWSCFPMFRPDVLFL